MKYIKLGMWFTAVFEWTMLVGFIFSYPPTSLTEWILAIGLLGFTGGCLILVTYGFTKIIDVLTKNNLEL